MHPLVLLLSLLATAPTPAAPTYCALTGPPYYAFPLVPTRNIPGTGLAVGTASVSKRMDSPFSVALTQDGSYAYDVRVSFTRLKRPRSGHLVAWVTTREIDQLQRMGALDEHFQASGSTSWNKFLVVVTLEAEDDPGQERWSGPVVFRGLSRAGMMHTMVGHGALQQENCAAYGYAN